MTPPGRFLPSSPATFTPFHLAVRRLRSQSSPLSSSGRGFGFFVHPMAPSVSKCHPFASSLSSLAAGFSPRPSPPSFSRSQYFSSSSLTSSSRWSLPSFPSSPLCSPPPLLCRHFRHRIVRQTDSSCSTSLSCRATVPSRVRFFSASSDVDDSDGRSRLSVAIVGAGPAGFYSAKYLRLEVLKRILAAVSNDDNGRDGEGGGDLATTNPPRIGWKGWTGIDVDLIERLPTPFGLVRYGVAPDHTEVKNVENDFAALFEKKNDDGDGGRSDGSEKCVSTVSYFGNVTVGRDVALADLRAMYDVVVLAYGCQADRALDVPVGDGEGKGDRENFPLEGVLSAREFVAWYNGHPEFGGVGPVVEECLWSSSAGDGRDPSFDSDAVSPAHVVIVGMGNVALDCARILVKGKPSLWNESDAPASVLRVLRGGVRKVTVLGRRGHVQGAFTIKELRELTKLRKASGCDADLVVRKDELDMGKTKASIEEMKSPAGRPKIRLDKLLYATAESERDEGGDDVDGSSISSSKQIHLRFLMNPVRLESRPKSNDGTTIDDRHRCVRSVACERTALTGESGKQRADGTGDIEIIPADLVLTSIGYKGLPLQGMDDMSFDDSKGTVAHDRGKVRRSDSNFGDDGNDNLFAAGWIKRGPTGIVGTNIGDAKDTVATVVGCLESGAISPSASFESGGRLENSGRKRLAEHLSMSGVRTVSWDEFCRINEAEKDVSRLRSAEQPREKFLSVKKMLGAINETERTQTGTTK